MSVRHLIAATCLAALTLSACSPASPPAPSGGANGAAAPATSSPVEPDTGAGGGAAALADIQLRLNPVARGFDQPLLVTNAGDGSGRLFVAEQTGRIRVVRDGRVAPRAFLDVSDRISTGGERGLLGLAFPSDYKDTGRFYVDYTDRAGNTVIARFIADDPASDTPKLTGPQVVFTANQPYSNHNGGCIEFAPDGTLWVGMGDGGAAGDPAGNAQNPTRLLGKILSLPVENPGAGRGRVKPKTVAIGLRNPWRFSFDPEGQDVWIGDVGQDLWEEIDLIPMDKIQGANFGWDLWEGDPPLPAGRQAARDGFVFPVVEYGREDGASVTGGYVYRGEQYPALDGVYVFGDFVSGKIWVARESSAGKVESVVALADSGITPSSFGVGEDRELYVCDYNGAVLQVTTR